jgi:hypothetical protein
MARRQMGHQLIMIFIFFSIYFSILFMVQFLTPIQNEKNFSVWNDKEKFNYSIYVISFVFYLVCSIILFFPYREFKAIAFGQNPALAAYFDNPANNDNTDKNDKKQP